MTCINPEERLSAPEVLDVLESVSTDSQVWVTLLVLSFYVVFLLLYRLKRLILFLK